MATYKNLEIKIKKKLSGDFLGSFQSAFKGLGTEFDSLREYIPGDSIKSIDWKSTAKLGDVHVKNFEEEKDLKILFSIENTKSLNFGSEDKTKKETLEEIFFLLAQSAISTGHSIGTFITHPQPLPTKEEKKISFVDFKKGEENIIKTLKLLQTSSNPSPNLFLSKGRGITKLNIKNTLIFVLTDSLEPNFTELKYLNISNEIIVLNIFDYFENNLSEEHFGGSFGNKIGTLFFGEKAKSKSYKQTRAEKVETLKKTLKKQKIEYLRLDNRDDIFLQFYKFFNAYNN